MMFVGSVNSALKHYSREKSQKVTIRKKKKFLKRKHAFGKHKTRFPNTPLVMLPKSLFKSGLCFDVTSILKYKKKLC